MSNKEKIEPERKSVAARMLAPLLTLVIFLFGFQYFLAQQNKILETRSGELAEPVQNAAETLESTMPTPKGGTAPKDTVIMLISELKESRDPTVAFPFVWWPSAFERLSEKARQDLQVHSAAALYRYYLDAYTLPSAEFLHRLSSDLDKVPPSNRSKLAYFLSKQMKERAKAPPFEDFVDALIEIKSEKVEQNNAEVRVAITKNRKTSQLSVNLVKISDKWMLQCLQLVKDPLGICKF